VPPAERSGVVVTAHRATNVDIPGRLAVLVGILRAVAARVGPVTLPLHPRTGARLDESGMRGALGSAGIRVVPPLPYPEMLTLVATSQLVITDSGGLQEEASWYGTPTVVLRNSTPRWESVGSGAASLVGLDHDRALAAVERYLRPDVREEVFRLPCPYGDGATSERVADLLCDPGIDRMLAFDEPDLSLYERRVAPMAEFSLDA
jgi:UDP-N-acetylglucosamine 2-epimerase (non-hydrolysing)